MYGIKNRIPAPHKQQQAKNITASITIPMAVEINI
jgi:hypothetical protein